MTSPRGSRARIAATAPPASPGSGSRAARLTTAAAPAAIVPPKQPRGEHGTAPIPLWVVAVREIDAPAEVEALEWLLLTDLPAGDLQGACRAVDWYARRPIVEELHKG